jgi:hypothetical protein
VTGTGRYDKCEPAQIQLHIPRITPGRRWLALKLDTVSGECQRTGLEYIEQLGQ